MFLKYKMLQTKQSVSSSRALDEMARTKRKQHNKTRRCDHLPLIGNFIQAHMSVGEVKDIKWSLLKLKSNSFC